MKKCIVFIISVLMFGMFIPDKVQAKAGNTVYTIAQKPKNNRRGCLCSYQDKKNPSSGGAYFHRADCFFKFSAGENQYSGQFKR